MPDRVGPAGNRTRGRIRLGDEDEAAETHQRKRLGAPGVAPCLAKTIEARPDCGRGVEAHHLESVAGRPRRAVRRVDAIPHRRMRLLPRLELHRHIFEMKEIAMERQRPLGEPLEHELERLAVHLV